MSEPNFESLRRPLVASLTRKFGSANLELILDAAQESFVSALTSWPHHGTPEKPFSWLYRVAERKIIDQLRSQNREVTVQEDLEEINGVEQAEIALYTMVCSPKLTIREQVCLALRTLSGLTAQEIARLLLESEEAVQRRISRCKDKLSNDDLTPRHPEEHLPTILTTLYLLFTEGYEAGRGDEYIRPELAYSALRLGEELRQLLLHPNGELDALLALMHLHCARMPSRLTEQGEMVFFEQQDHSKIHQGHLNRGFQYLESAQISPNLSRYHLEAGLAAAIARNADWQEIGQWHLLLATYYPTPLNQISHAIAIGKTDGPLAALNKLKVLPEEVQTKQPAHFASACAYFLTELGRTDEAKALYQKALAHSMSAPTKRGLERRLEELGDGNR